MPFLKHFFVKELYLVTSVTKHNAWEKDLSNEIGAFELLYTLTIALNTG